MRTTTAPIHLFFSVVCVASTTHPGPPQPPRRPPPPPPPPPRPPPPPAPPPPASSFVCVRCPHLPLCRCQPHHSFGDPNLARAGSHTLLSIAPAPIHHLRHFLRRSAASLLLRPCLARPRGVCSCPPLSGALQVEDSFFFCDSRVMPHNPRSQSPSIHPSIHPSCGRTFTSMAHLAHHHSSSRALPPHSLIDAHGLHSSFRQLLRHRRDSLSLFSTLHHHHYCYCSLSLSLSSPSVRIRASPSTSLFFFTPPEKSLHRHLRSRIIAQIVREFLFLEPAVMFSRLVRESLLLLRVPSVHSTSDSRLMYTKSFIIGSAPSLATVCHPSDRYRTRTTVEPS
jgi:hypothetical protein